MSLCTPCQQALPPFPSPGGSGDTNKGYLSKPIVFINPRLPKSHLLLHTSWESFMTSLEADCPVCWTIWRNIRSSPIVSPDHENIEDFRADILRATYNPKDSAYLITVSIEGRELKQPSLLLNIWKTNKEFFEQVEDETPMPIEHTPQSAAQAANRWISICDSEHSSCLDRATSPPEAKMPTRLLDLGGSDSTTWCLIETQQEKVPYVALSHRWTADTPTLLTKDYAEYFNPQSDALLPQSYRDIVEICRALPIRYLWIDSLCIIQDDNGADFRHEAPLMMDVYRYAFITIMICWEFGETTAFRKRRPRGIARPPPKSYHDDSTRSTNSLVNAAEDFAFIVQNKTNDYRTDVDKSPINKRAWVLQERHLSRRILCLGSDQLYWECQGDSIGSCMSREACPENFSSFGNRLPLQPLTDNDEGLSWSLIAEQYSQQDLTYEQDRVVAISGLAKVISTLSGDTYFIGIWLESWMTGLLWEPDQAKDRPHRPKPSHTDSPPIVLPSWSWLSFLGSVYLSSEGPRISRTDPNSFESEVFRPLAILSRTTLLPVDADPSFSFDRVMLHIRCLLIPVEFGGVANEENLPSFFKLNHEIELQSMGIDRLHLVSCQDDRREYGVMKVRFSKPIKTSSRYFLVPLYLRKENAAEPQKLSPDDTEGFGLVLEESYHDGEREFIRVGMWQEDYGCSSQLGPMISNTIAKGCLAEAESKRIGGITEMEQVFDNKLREYALRHASSGVNFPWKEQEEHVQCSLLPHFTHADWATISLV
ncbi:heterokaryon incompatibility protein-domain-containing protein [Fusarium redolens]|uniref:Heterokaryon incompatibility protein-domain-containing protein n=1 Tax=Fusarium redolens TaxID=48865 RepID=A0A9P9HKF4_FUSRE|nr:heterokaryon incompatibility protein-domain-containing protein [Fusarium redolens]KAH7258876.1 heterokaryon incompatibility protein-domain-containing protein [Fusarium redolens]